MKAFFAKMWSWIVLHKIVSIVIAAALVAGITCAIAIPIALSGSDDPGETTTAPEEITTAPGETTVAPEETTVAPEEITTVPEEITTVPEEITTTPEETTTTPEETTTAPEETTTAFEETTTASEETTEEPAPEKITATITGIQDLSKTYDATAVVYPTFSTNFNDTVTFEWYKDGVKLDSAPVDVGKYTVRIVIPETEEFKAATAEREFFITKRELTVTALEKTYDGSLFIEFEATEEQGVIAGDTVTVTFGLVDARNAGTYTDVAVNHRELDNENYTISTERVDLVINKRPVWAENVKFTYDGYDNFYGDYAVSAITFQDVVTGETINACDIVFKFDNKDVGSGLIAVGYDDGITGNYEFDLSKCTASIVKRPIWAQNTEFVYDGSENFCGDEYPVAVLQNVVAGDTVELCDITWYFDSKNVGATLIEVDLTEEYYPNYEIDFSKCTASIVKRPVWVTDVKFVYDGSDNFYGDYAVSAITFQNVVTGEAINPCDIVFTFEDINVGSALTAVNYDDGITSNYEFDLSKCTVSIVPKELDVSGLSSSFVYNYSEHQHNVQIPGLIEGENLTYYVNFKSKDVGSDPLYYGFFVNNSTSTKEETLLNYKPSGYADWSEWGLEMYNKAEITPVLVEFPELITKEYDQTADFTFAISDISVQNVTVSLKAVDADENALKDAGEYVDCNASSVVFYIDGFQTNNYAFVETEGVVNVTITPKQLNFSRLFFDGGKLYNYTYMEFNLGNAVGVYEGDVVRLHANFTKTPANNAAITLDTAASIFLFAENNGTLAKNYQLPADLSTITVYTSTFDYIIIDNSMGYGTYSVEDTFTGGIIYISVPADGGYIFSASENFISGSLYDEFGNLVKESTNTAGLYILSGDVKYYWMVGVNSSFASGAYLKVEKNLPTGVKEKPHQLEYDPNTFAAEDSRVDWLLDEYYYKVSLQTGTYYVAQAGLKVTVFDSYWNMVANLADVFNIEAAGSYYVYISKGDNAEVYDKIERFALVNGLMLDGNANNFDEDSYEQGVLVTDKSNVAQGGAISYCFEPEYNIASPYNTFEVLNEDGTENIFSQAVISYRFYDKNFKEVNVIWDGETLNFPNGYTDDRIYVVIQYNETTGVYLRAE